MVIKDKEEWIKKLEGERSNFHPVMIMPSDYDVYDLRFGEENALPKGAIPRPYGIGRYGEKRLGMYKTELFGGNRNIHMGIDFCGPLGEPVYAFCDGIIYMTAYNAAAGDYGNTIVTQHEVGGVSLYALYGHLSARSLEESTVRQKIKKGEVIGWLGNRDENGGWEPHLHFQISFEPPVKCDMPGVVTESDWPKAQEIYPDPQIIVGPLY